MLKGKQCEKRKRVEKECEKRKRESREGVRVEKGVQEEKERD